MPETTARPWDQRPDEPPAAFLAFSHYRDLGPGRTLIGAARSLAGARPGRPGAGSGPGKAGKGRSGPVNDVPGAFRRWLKAHRWAERAAAYDEFLAQAKDRGAARAAEAAAGDLFALAAREEEAEIKAVLEDARLLRTQGRRQVSLPVRDTVLPEPDEQGRRVTYLGSDPKVHAVGCKLLTAAGALAQNAIARARAAAGAPAIAPGPPMLGGPPGGEPEDRAAEDAEWLKSLEALLNASTGPAVIRRGSSTSTPGSTTLKVSAAG